MPSSRAFFRVHAPRPDFLGACPERAELRAQARRPRGRCTSRMSFLRPPRSVQAFVHLVALILLLTSTDGFRRAHSQTLALPGSGQEESGEDLSYVSLASIAAQPLSHLGTRFETVIQVHSRPEAWNPLLTRFGAGDYLGLRSWADEQLLWDQEQYDDPAGLVFVRRGTPAAETLAGAERYARFRVQARVAQVFAGRAWIEVHSAQRLPDAMTDGAVLHATRALQLLASGEWALALEDIARAMDSWPPPVAREELSRLRLLAREQMVRTAARK